MKKYKFINFVLKFLLYFILISTFVSVILSISSNEDNMIFTLFIPVFLTKKAMLLSPPFNVFFIYFFVTIPLIIFIYFILNLYSKKFFLRWFTVYYLLDSIISIIYDSKINISLLFVYLIKLFFILFFTYIVIKNKYVCFKNNKFLDQIIILLNNYIYRNLVLLSSIFLFTRAFYLYGFVKIICDYNLSIFSKIVLGLIFIAFNAFIICIYIRYVRNTLTNGKEDDKDDDYFRDNYFLSKFLLVLTFYFSINKTNDIYIISNFATAYARIFINDYFGLSKFILKIIFIIPLSILFLSIVIGIRNKKIMDMAVYISWLDELLYIVYKIIYKIPMLDIIAPIKILYLCILTESTILGKKLPRKFIFRKSGDKIYRNAKNYTYNSEYAKNYTFISVLLFGLLTCFGLYLEYKCFIKARFTSTWPVYLFIMFCLFITYVLILAGLQPFIFTWKYSFYRKSRWIYRVSYLDDQRSDIYTDLKVTKKNNCFYFCVYTDYKNRKKRLIIPNCYPEIEDILYQ